MRKDVKATDALKWLRLNSQINVDYITIHDVSYTRIHKTWNGSMPRFMLENLKKNLTSLRSDVNIIESVKIDNDLVEFVSIEYEDYHDQPESFHQDSSA